MNDRRSEIVHTIECTSDILNGCFSRSGRYLALTTMSKSLLVYDVSSYECLANRLKRRWLVMTRTMEKKCSAILSCEYQGKEYVIVGDKVGDISIYDFPSAENRKFLMGHFGTVITDLAFVGDYLASSDRDEKVFVCQFPKTYLIQSICVGHKQFVSCVASTDRLLVSGSADGTVRLWEAASGREQHRWFLDEILVVTKHPNDA